MPQATIEASADAWIDEAEPTANNGGLTLLVRSEDGADRRSPIQFDMDQLPADFLEFEDSARMDVEVTVKDPDDDQDRTIELWWYASSFSEASITWDTQPGNEFSGAAGSDQAASADQVLRYDLLGFIDQVPTSGSWPLYLRDGTEDSSDLLAPFEVTLYSRATLDPPVFVFDYRAENEADLSSQVTPRIPGHADVDSQVLPRLSDVADLDSTVEPFYSTHLTGVVEVQPIEIDDGHQARVRGRVSITLEGVLADVQDVFDEVATTVTVDGTQAEAIVQLVDESTVDVPTQRPGDPAVLHRGDARLFALGDGSTFEPGDTVTWQGIEFRVVGVLDEARVTDEALFSELGLRRLATRHEARAIGTVGTS